MNKEADEQKKPMNRNSAAQKSPAFFREAGFWISGRGCGIEEKQKQKSKLTGKKTGR